MASSQEDGISPTNVNQVGAPQFNPMDDSRLSNNKRKVTDVEQRNVQAGVSNLSITTIPEKKQKVGPQILDAGTANQDKENVLPVKVHSSIVPNIHGAQSSQTFFIDPGVLLPSTQDATHATPPRTPAIPTAAASINSTLPSAVDVKMPINIPRPTDPAEEVDSGDPTCNTPPPTITGPCTFKSTKISVVKTEHVQNSPQPIVLSEMPPMDPVHMPQNTSSKPPLPGREASIEIGKRKINEAEKDGNSAINVMNSVPLNSAVTIRHVAPLNKPSINNGVNTNSATTQIQPVRTTAQSQNQRQLRCASGTLGQGVVPPTNVRKVPGVHSPVPSGIIQQLGPSTAPVVHGSSPPRNVRQIRPLIAPNLQSAAQTGNAHQVRSAMPLTMQGITPVQVIRQTRVVNPNVVQGAVPAGNVQQYIPAQISTVKGTAPTSNLQQTRVVKANVVHGAVPAGNVQQFIPVPKPIARSAVPTSNVQLRPVPVRNVQKTGIAKAPVAQRTVSAGNVQRPGQMNLGQRGTAKVPVAQGAHPVGSVQQTRPLNVADVRGAVPSGTFQQVSQVSAHTAHKRNSQESCHGNRRVKQGVGRTNMTFAATVQNAVAMKKVQGVVVDGQAAGSTVQNGSLQQHHVQAINPHAIPVTPVKSSGNIEGTGAKITDRRAVGSLLPRLPVPNENLSAAKLPRQSAKHQVDGRKRVAGPSLPVQKGNPHAPIHEPLGDLEEKDFLNWEDMADIFVPEFLEEMKKGLPSDENLLVFDEKWVEGETAIEQSLKYFDAS